MKIPKTPIEIHPVATRNGNITQVEEHEAEFFGIYHRLSDGLLEHITDRPTRAEADAFCAVQHES